jgi:SAM-dependent methyltransferase
MRRAVAGRMHPGRCPICGPTIFDARGAWLRDEYLCRRCGSIPRQRALIFVLQQVMPDWPNRTIFESSPSGPASALLARRCRAYTPSHFFDNTPAGAWRDGARSEDLRALTLADACVDIVVTQDVFEHVVDPTTAFREIARVLRPGGAHVCTVPIYSRERTVVRVSDDGVDVMEREYHGNPIGDGRSLVVREWGDDVTRFIEDAAGTPTERHAVTSWFHGLRGEMKDVLVSRKT